MNASDAWEEQQRRRWTRPDGFRWIVPDRAHRHDPEFAAVVERHYALTRWRSYAERRAEDEHAARDARERAELARLRTEHDAIRAEIADLKAYFAAKANFDPAQPRDDSGRWTDTGAGQRSERIRLAASDKPTLGRNGHDLGWSRHLRLEFDLADVSADRPHRSG
jgi:hypothetical protein